MRFERFMWWSPTKVTQPWRPSVFRGCDEWHNPSVGVVVPFLGAFIWFTGRDFSRHGEPHVSAWGSGSGFVGRLVNGCADCSDFLKHVWDNCLPDGALIDPSTEQVVVPVQTTCDYCGSGVTERDEDGKRHSLVVLKRIGGDR